MASGGAALSQAIRNLLSRVVETPGGFSLLCRGQLECVASFFQVPVHLIDEVRTLLEQPASRALIARTLVDARHENHDHPRPPPPKHAPPAHEQKDVDQLLRDVERCPGGVELLLNAPIETSAICFGAHPFVVQEARERLERSKPVVSKKGDEQAG